MSAKIIHEHKHFAWARGDVTMLFVVVVVLIYRSHAGTP